METACRVHDLDGVLHEKSRLAIVSILAVDDGLSFRELKDRTGMTDGNLGVHLRVLEAAGYVGVQKSFVGRRPQTRAALSESGRNALARYVDHLDAIVRQVRADTVGDRKEGGGHGAPTQPSPLRRKNAARARSAASEGPTSGS